MFSHSLLLVLLVLACLQSFTMAENAHTPGQCCFNYQKSPIPGRIIKGYKETGLECPRPGVILTLKNGRQVCTNPKDKWLKNIMEQIDQRVVKSMTSIQSSA